MTGARLSGRVAGGSTGPRFPPWSSEWLCCWSGGLGQGADAVPGGDDRGCPGPGGGDLEVAPAAAAGQAAGGVQDAVAQGLGFGFGEVAVEGEQPQPGEQGGGGQRGGQPGLVEGEQVGGSLN